MKAVLHTRFGPPDELKVKEIEKPVPKDNEVLIKIHATTVTTSDCNLRNLTFVPGPFRVPARLFMMGVFRPRIKILGMDLAGEVESVGREVTRFRPGDRVFGTPEPAYGGAHAEYICIPEAGNIVPLPAGISWEDAAPVSVTGITALYFIRDLGEVREGDKILIIGASGGIGTWAVQLAKYYGAEVTGVCSTPNLDLVKSLGADRVIDYTKEDYTGTGEKYDIVFDIPGKSSYSRCRDLLSEKGIFLANQIEFPELMRILWSGITGSRRVRGGMAVPSQDDLSFMMELIHRGTLKTVIGKTYPFKDIPEAFRYVETGHKRGNVVITVT